MKFIRFFKLVLKRFFSNGPESHYAGFVIAEKISTFLSVKFFFSEYGRIWLDDDEFFKSYKRFNPTNFHSADRKYFLKNLLYLIDGIEGDTVECGVYHGASSWLICDHIKKGKKRKHHIFDSFEGLSSPLKEDSAYWRHGSLSVSEESVLKNLSEFDFIKTYKGWIPERFKDVTDLNFSFVHIDVDLYQPTFDSLSFFYYRMQRGGIILCDDYGFNNCPGAQKAFDEFMCDKEEKIISVPTGQCFIIKK